MMLTNSDRPNPAAPKLRLPSVTIRIRCGHGRSKTISANLLPLNRAISVRGIATPRLAMRDFGGLSIAASVIRNSHLTRQPAADEIGGDPGESATAAGKLLIQESRHTITGLRGALEGEKLRVCRVVQREHRFILAGSHARNGGSRRNIS